MAFEKIIDIINDTFPTSLKNNTIDLISYINNNSTSFEQLFGYWENQLYFMVKYKNESVCYILLNGTGDEKQFSPLTIWSDDSGSKWYENFNLPEELKQVAYSNIDYCVHCGSCSGGKRKIIFGREFDNVCMCVFRFTNPDEQEFNLIKELINARKKSIEQ